MKALFVKLGNWIAWHKKLSITIGVAMLLVVGGGAFFALVKLGYLKPITRISITGVTKAEKKPVTKASPLTGVEVATELADRPVTAVVIENFYPDARPQSGLGDAGVVYEALAEGGITRFLAFFLENQPTELGPVRSLRTYFVDWALEFDAPVAHVGGNIDALDMVGPLKMKNMDEFANGSYFYRSADRYAPHNAYTSSDKLDALEKTLGYDNPATFKPSPRKADAPPAADTTAANPVIDLNYSYAGYDVQYKYDPVSNDYARFSYKQPFIDRNTGKQIHVKNIVVEYMPTTYGNTRIGEQTVVMATPGSGEALVFRDGGVVTGTWSKATHSDRTQLKDTSGAEIPLNAGNTWYSIMPVGRTVSY